jgi:hypothetical protein
MKIRKENDAWAQSIQNKGRALQHVHTSKPVQAPRTSEGKGMQAEPSEPVQTLLHVCTGKQQRKQAAHPQQHGVQQPKGEGGSEACLRWR